MSVRRSATRAAAASFFAAFALLLGACTTPTPESSYSTRVPKTDPVATRTTFSGALSCMDQLLQVHAGHGTLITSVGIPDATGQVQVGSRDMLMSAMSDMTRRSGAFTYVDLDVTREEALAIHGNRPDKQSLWPEYLIRGTISGLDENVNDASKGVGLSVGFSDNDANAAYARSETSSVVSLDLFIVRARDLVLLPGLKASNSLAIAREGSAKDAGLTISQVGLDFSVELEESESLAFAIRTLIELGTVELIGKFAQVPYWQCLQVDGTNPKVMAEAAEWYAGMDDDERILFAQRVLIASGDLAGPASGKRDTATTAAIARYQEANGLLPTGRMSFELYYSMLGNDRPAEVGEPAAVSQVEAPVQDAPEPSAAPEPVSAPEPAAAPLPVAAPEPAPAAEPLLLTIVTERGPSPAFAPDEMLDIRVGVSRDAYVYCYYEDGAGRISRIFPNRGTPDPYLTAGHMVEIPPRDERGRLSHFGIQLQHPGANEEIACLASDRELGIWLPTALKQKDLEPLPVQSLAEVETAFDEVDGGGVVRARLPIAVTN